jgi:hypothetical protein
LGGIANNTGRIWIYPRQTASCLGKVAVTFFNTSLDPVNYDYEYTYDVYGLINKVSLTRNDALNMYRTSNCAHSDGAYVDASNQTQFRCLGQRITCNGTRPFSPATLQAIPIPHFACRNESTPNSSEFMIWKVRSPQKPGEGFDAYYGLTLRQNTPTPLPTEWLAFQGPQYPNQVLPSGASRQYRAFNQDFDSQAYLFFGGRITSFDPEYIRSEDEIVRDIPCICGFSVDCIGGVIDITSIASSYIKFDNKIPIADPGPAIEIPQGNLNFTLDATPSYDDDNAPQPLTYLWTFYKAIPSYLPVFNLSSFDVTQPVLIIPTQGFPPGKYIFLLRVSDSQDISYNFFNVTIIENKVVAVVELDKTAAVGSCVELSGIYSYSTDPSIPITSYTWSQVSGPPLDVYPGTFPCNVSTEEGMLTNTNLVNATVAFHYVGWHTFNLTVSDGNDFDSVLLSIHVVPNYTTPVAPPFSLPNYTNPPLRTKPPNNRSNMSFPNFTTPEEPSTSFSPPPITPVSVPSLLPSHPLLSQRETVFMLFLLVAQLATILVVVGIIVAIYRQEPLRRWDIIWRPRQM